MKTFFRSKRNRIISIVLLLILIILSVAPTLIKNYAVNHSQELVGRQIAIDKLKYNYFTSTVRVLDFKMLEANKKDTFVSFDTLIINLEPLRFLLGEKNLEQFYIKGLEVRIQKQDTTFNFDDLVAFHTQTSDTLETEKEDDFKYHLSNLELKSANFYFDDRDVGKVTAIDNFSFFIPEIVWDQTKKSNADLEFSFINGGYFKGNLNINPVNGEFDATIDVNRLHLDAFYEYAAQYAEINTLNGTVNSSVHIMGNTEDATKSIVTGQVEVSDFYMTDTANKEFLKADLAKAELKEIDYSNSSYKFGTIDLTKPYLYFEMDSLSNNYFRIFKLNEVDTMATSSNSIQPDSSANSNLYYEINKLKVNDGLMDYSDNLTGQRFDYHLNQIAIDSDPIKSNANWINIYADMLLNNRGTLKSKLGINPLAYENLDLDLVIENFLLSDINIYANYYTGHNILVGDFYYYSKSKITDGAIESENQLLVKNVDVENAKGGVFTLPLKFALFLLKDKNGDVNLNVPVRGDLNDPEINIGKLVWTTIKNKITGAASDPIGSLAGLVDVKPEDYKELEFAYTDTIPSEENYIKLDKLLEMETAKDGLKVQLEHYVDTKLQMEALAIDALGQKYFRDEKKNYKDNENDFSRYVRRETKNDSISIKDAALSLVSEPELTALAKSYQEALRENINNYLKKTKPTTNIEAVSVSADEPDLTGAQNHFKIKFDMLSVMSDDPSINSSNE